ncbi:MAG: DUF2071 domain-containing protein [Acidimicrobiia bacterium]|nr:DUF2071 domain-containing protein [Acidimicrobiia bacterium]NNC41817.1 DUF2071 domain-containing protein [Acidimicrobiia bacterium]NNL47221.1 DUF2071 domain-containing protein [Acidimicrobiia bacterium]
MNAYSPTTPDPVSRPIMLQGWKDLSYIHWPYDPPAVQHLLPDNLEVDTFEGQAWVGLVAFHMEKIRLPGTPGVPYLGTFPETNVRTYVRGPDGRPGVWFDSLDINRLLPVLVARASYRLPYMWSAMSIEHDGNLVSYQARRRWPGPRDTTSNFTIKRNEPVAPADITPLEHFLTARWGLFTQLRSRLAYAPVDHPAWPLEQAELTQLDDHLIAAAGYPPPSGDPLVHYSPGVDVRIGLPHITSTTQKQKTDRDA